MGHMTIYSHFPALPSSSESTQFKGVARVSSFPFLGFAVLSFLFKVLSLGLNFFLRSLPPFILRNVFFL